MRTLAGLPPELFLLILDFLSVVDITCLSLCNHRFRELSLSQMIGQSSLTKDEKLSILNRLERDSPEYFACDICHVLHRYDGSESFGLHGLYRERTCRLPCVTKWFLYPFTLDSCYNWNYPLSFLQLKLAMRRFYYGPRAGINTDSLSYTQIKQFSSGTISLFSQDAEIYPKLPGLHLRIQDITVTRFVKSLLRRQVASLTHNCGLCNTDSEIEIVGFDSQVALIMTRWTNLGPGLTQEDPLWNTHSYWPFSSRERLDHPPHPTSFCSPRLCFEKTISCSYEKLQSRNLGYLKDQQYKNGKPFIQRGLNFWNISYQEPMKENGINSMWSQIKGRWATYRREKADETRNARDSPISKSPSRENRGSDSLFDFSMSLQQLWLFMYLCDL
ncbi:hypothetical protein F1880_002085 [Penicillium rolfsii]|nr:hypothetical protein F1880_002085 [Penicillium rolfsii]